MTQIQIEDIKREEQHALMSSFREALNSNGYEDFTISQSVTSWGVSTYLIGMGLKFRISDHSVSSCERLSDEIHITEDWTAERVLAHAQKQAELEALNSNQELKAQFDSLLNNELQGYKFLVLRNSDLSEEQVSRVYGSVVAKFEVDGKFTYEIASRSYGVRYPSLKTIETLIKKYRA